MRFYIGTFRRSRRTLEEQARKIIMQETQNPNPVVRFYIGTFYRSKTTLNEQLNKMIEQNQITS